jgi:excisionase family DNA binding protein
MIHPPIVLLSMLLSRFYGSSKLVLLIMDHASLFTETVYAYLPKLCIAIYRFLCTVIYRSHYCTHTCNQKHYKAVKQLEKVKAAGKIIAPIRETVNNAGKYMSIPEAARLLGVTDRTVFRLIRRKVIKPLKQGRTVKIETNQLLKIKVYENIY